MEILDRKIFNNKNEIIYSVIYNFSNLDPKAKPGEFPYRDYDMITDFKTEDEAYAAARTVLILKEDIKHVSIMKDIWGYNNTGEWVLLDGICVGDLFAEDEDEKDIDKNKKVNFDATGTKYLS